MVIIQLGKNLGENKGKTLKLTIFKLVNRQITEQISFDGGISADLKRFISSQLVMLNFGKHSFCAISIKLMNFYK